MISNSKNDYIFQFLYFMSNALKVISSLFGVLCLDHFDLSPSSFKSNGVTTLILKAEALLTVSVTVLLNAY